MATEDTRGHLHMVCRRGGRVQIVAVEGRSTHLIVVAARDIPILRTNVDEKEPCT